MDLIVLVITITAGYQHESIPVAEEVIAQLARGAFQVRYVRTPEEMPSSLDGVAVVMLVNTTGELPRTLDLPRWVAGGGALIGVHSASDTWHEWPEYIAMLGGEFETHPEEMSRNLLVVDAAHPSTKDLPSPFALFEEYYVFKNLAPSNLLVTLDDGAPISWSRKHGAGRVFYTALGHRNDVWASAWFQQHLAGAITWALQKGPRRRAVTH